MNNEIQRKITSLTLMTIMLAGGMAIAFPGMEPAYAANPQLYVSAEETGNFAGIQVIEIVVNDPNRSSTSDSEGRPDVGINGDDVFMTQADDGAWYAYVANNLAIQNFDDIEFIYGTTSSSTKETIRSGSGAENVFINLDGFLDGAKDLVFGSFTIPADTITVDNVLFVAGEDFGVSGSDAADAQNLAKVIKDTLRTVTATSTGSTVTVTAVNSGESGNDIGLSTNDSDSLKISGKTSGGKDAATATATITVNNPAIATRATADIEFENVQIGTTITVDGQVYTAGTDFQRDSINSKDAKSFADAVLSKQSVDLKVTSSGSVITISPEDITKSLTVVTNESEEVAISTTAKITGDSVTIGGTAFTLGIGVLAGSTDEANAQSLAITINAENNKAPQTVNYLAVADGKVVTITATESGVKGNLIALSTSNAANFAVSGNMAGGADVVQATATITLADVEAESEEKRKQDNNNSYDNNFGLQSEDWPFIQTYDIASDSDVTITYGAGGQAQRAEILYEYDSSVDISFDRQDYPRGANVQIELNDSLLNLSPTADDLWAFDVETEEVTYFIEGTKIHATNVDWTGIGFEEGPIEYSNRDGVLEIVDTRISNDLDETDDNEYIIFRSSDSDDNLFVNHDHRDKSGLIVVGTGRASISYNDGHSIINDAFVGTIEFANVKEWLSGVELEITLVDEDRNLDSRIDEEMSILEDEVPFIKVGSPIHLDDKEIELDNASIRDASKGSKTFTMTVDNDKSEIEIAFQVPYQEYAGDDYVFNYISYDFSEIGGDSGMKLLDKSDINSDDYELTFDVDSGARGVVYFDVFSFGQKGPLTTNDDGVIKDNVPRVNDAFYRLELEESDKDSAKFEGTVEYIMINQLNVFDEDTYEDINTTGDDVVIIVNDDMDGSDSITVTYYDVDSTGDSIISTQQEANTHTGVIELDDSSYTSGSTISITLIDADLNTDSNTKQVYDVDRDNNWIGDDDTWLVKLLIDDTPYDGSTCDDSDDAKRYNLYKTGLTLTQTSRTSDTFEGTLELPAFYCDNRGNLVETNGLDLDVEYQDYSDASGKSNESSASSSLRSHTGSVTLDRTVYPPPFGVNEFATYNGDLDDNDYSDALDAGDVIVTIAVDDSDANVSASGTDKLSTEYLTLELHRGSSSLEIDIGDSFMVETRPSSGIFDVEVAIPQQDYEGSDWKFKDGRINQGDILTVEYTDPQDASGDENSVTDSATFDLRNAVLQSDKSVYIIGSEAIITLIEPDLNLDSETAETWSLDLINWNSDAARSIELSDNVFDANPNGLRETGDSTGIFQVVIEIPQEIYGDKLERGEQISLEYQDNGPAGADYVGDDEEDINLDIFTSNFGATISLDQKVYTWTDKVYITVVAPDHNFDSNVINEIGADRDSEVKITTRSEKLENYKLVETGPDTGIFTGEVILTGFDSHDADGDGESGDASGITSVRNAGPTNGMLSASDDDGLSVSFEFSDGETVVGSSLIRWNIGEVQWLEASYPASGSGVLRVIDPDMNLKPEAVDSFDVSVWSDTVTGGINLRVTETNEATGIFEGTVFFTTTSTSSGSRLLVSEGDTVTAEYEDNTLPDPYSTADELSITSTTIIGTLVPPLERAPSGNLKVVDAFSNTLDVIQIDQQVQIQADIVNSQDRNQKFAYLVQIQDRDGVTVSLSWITGDLKSGQSLTSAVSWIPESIGSHTAQVFVWESVDNPTALSPPRTIAILVR